MKESVLKTLLKKFITKAQVWIKQTGLTNVFYLAIALGLGMGIIPLFFLSFLKSYLVGAALGIFVYLNWNIIVKLYKAKIGDKLSDVLEDMSKKMDEKLGDAFPLRCDECGKRYESCECGSAGDSGGPL